jgi:ABC-type cobalamin transport system permease subunit
MIQALTALAVLVGTVLGILVGAFVLWCLLAATAAGLRRRTRPPLEG